MKNDYTDSKFKKLLNKLQQESWQLELLISGFAIFGLISALGPLNIGLNEASATESYSKIFYLITKIACYVLIVNLIIHVVLRGLWIGAIGLRYVSGEIDYDALNYNKRFTNYLKKNVGSFDKYIGNLENYCSILFAVTFLYLFYIISFFLFLFIIYLASALFIESGIFPKFMGFMILGFFSIFFIIISFFVFLDFLTQGLLKKKEWISFLYFPVYKVFSVITLSFLYRPLVYNFLDNKFGRRLLLTLLPVYFAAFYISTTYNVRSNYINKQTFSTVNYANNSNYLDALTDDQYIRKAAIPSKIITTPFLKVFIPFRENIEDLVLEYHPNLKPLNDKRGFSSSFFDSNKRNFVKDSLQTNYLTAFKNTYNLKIDDTEIDSDYVISEINNQIGLEAIFSISDFADGKHIVQINRLKKNKSALELEMEMENVIEIPFWYYKQ